MSKIKAVLFGIGNMGSLIAKYLIEKDVEITGAISRSRIGEDVGEVSQLKRPLGVKISDDPKGVLTSAQANVAILATCSSMAELYPDAKLCFEHGLDVITITEGAFYPWSYDPDMAADLDALAKAHGVSLTATGVQDIFWTNTIALLTGACHQIDSIEFEGEADFGPLGPAVLNLFPLGLTPEQFMQAAPPPDAKPPASIIGTALEAMINKLALSIKRVDGGIELVTADSDIECVSLGKLIKTGHISGLRENITIETLEGPVMRANFAAKIFEPGDEENYTWNIKGVPNIHLRQNNVPSVPITCASAVNRIPDIINAPPGFITAEKLDTPFFRASALETYLTK